MYPNHLSATNLISRCAARLAILAFGCLAARAVDSPLVNHADTWRYRKGTSAPQANWKTATDAGLDASWLSGKGGFGYSDSAPEVALCQTLLPDMKSSYSSLYFRKSFEVTTPPGSDLHLILKVDFDDGFIAWLDGHFLASNNAPGQQTEPAFNQPATAKHESSLGDSSKHSPSRYDLGAVGLRLSAGTHVLAVMGLNQDAASSDFVQLADLAYGIPTTNCISGSITANTTWAIATSPIVVCDTVTVEAGATLTIDPGVTIQFDTGAALVVADGGKLLAEGATNAPILFTHRTGSGNWDHLTILGSVGSPETRIAHAHFDFNVADTGTPCIEVAAGTADLDHLTFGNTDAPYIHVDGASFVIRNCLFPPATQRFEPVHGTKGVKNGGHGIFLRNYFGSPIGYNDVVDFTGGNRPAPIVHFFNNVLEASQDDGFDIDGTDAWVEGNIFLHVHRNNGTPDSSAAVSGGNDSTRTSRITIVRNLFFDCDNAATAKQGNFYVMANNTIVHTTKTGGVDGGSGAINVRDTTPSPTTFAKGYYLEGNIVVDAEELVRNYDAAQTTVTLINNFISESWSGPGSGNSLVNPLLERIPTVPETRFTTWAQAQVIKSWFGLKSNSPAIGVGPNGVDAGALVASGVSIRQIPASPADPHSAQFVMGPHWSTPHAPLEGWPSGAGYTHYRWRLDGGAWSLEVLVSHNLTLAGLSDGEHQLEVVGRLDSGLYQDDPLFHDDASVSRLTWTVGQALRFNRILSPAPGVVELGFIAFAGTDYELQYRETLDGGSWQLLEHFPPALTQTQVVRQDHPPSGTSTRYYRIVQR